MNRFLSGKLREPRICACIARERLAAPLLLNLLSVFVGIFGPFRVKVKFDLVPRMHHACGVVPVWTAFLGVLGLRPLVLLQAQKRALA